MISIFPNTIGKMPLADVPLDGVQAPLSQVPNYQIRFMEFDKNAGPAPISNFILTQYR